MLPVQGSKDLQVPTPAPACWPALPNRWYVPSRHGYAWPGLISHSSVPVFRQACSRATLTGWSGPLVGSWMRSRVDKIVAMVSELIRLLLSAVEWAKVRLFTLFDSPSRFFSGFQAQSIKRPTRLFKHSHSEQANGCGPECSMRRRSRAATAAHGPRSRVRLCPCW